MPLRRIVLVRHGETEGESSVRFHGRTDVDLSREGRAQLRRVAARLSGEPLDLLVASPLQRSWKAAALMVPGAPVRLEADFREIDFGRWEGLTQEEIRAADPVLHEDWQSGAEDFEYPRGESRAAFRERVGRGLERLLAASPGHGALAVLHKGVIREIVRRLTGQSLEKDEPPLAGVVKLTRAPDGSWFVGSHSSDPPALQQRAEGGEGAGSGVDERAA